MNMKDFLDNNRIPTAMPGQHHHARHGWIQTDCPFCTPGESKFRLGYNVQGGYFSCWGCGPKQTYSTVAKLLKLSVTKAILLLKGVDKAKRSERTKQLTAVGGKCVFPDNLMPLMPLGVMYLHERRFNAKQIVNLWNIKSIKYDPLSNNNRLAHRIWIPIKYQDIVVSWTTRTVFDGQTRYITAAPHEEAIFHKDLLYGEDYCQTDSIVVHEGPFDVWRTGPGAVCTFGTNFNMKQVRKIAKYKRRAICFDNTPEGQYSARKLVDLLKVLPGETFNIKLDSKDMGEATDQERSEVRRRFLWPLGD